jgi:CubicO group peptidase (beta-lactamase class C family)
MMTVAQAGSPDEVAARVVAEGVAPLAAAGWAVREALAPASEQVRDVGGAAGTYFDLASVTKPMTAVAVAWAGLDRSTPLGHWVPEARGTPSGDVALELLLAHRAGLEAHRNFFEPLRSGTGGVDPAACLREAASARRVDAQGEPPAEGFAPLYSDLGYLLAGVALARAVGARDAGEAIGKLVLEPLGIADRVGTVRELEARGVTGPFAPTETVDWRGGQVSGAVHDENAWAMTGLGGSGHAGLFGTIDAVLTFGQAVLAGLDRLDWLVRERPGGTLRAGFDGKSAEGSSAGSRMGPRSFGHLGFTGTSLWIDPEARVVVSLLTNRVCPTRDNVAIRAARPCAHDALFHAAKAHVGLALGPASP